MKFIRLTRVDQEWSGTPCTNPVSVHAESIRWMEERNRPSWLTANAPPTVTFIQLSGEGMRNDQWIKVLEPMSEVEVLLA